MEQHTGNIFEHTFENVSSYGVASRMEVLKKRGEDGWELVSVIQDNHLHCFYWK